jgi:O-acetyl-ADP-ribose deacetylase (regulator of RNase III)
VIHTVGPIWSGGTGGEDGLLAACYRNSLVLARGQGIRSISFPSISTGAYRFPVDRAAAVALTAVRKFLQHQVHDFQEVRFVLFSEHDLKVYQQTWQNLCKK